MATMDEEASGEESYDSIPHPEYEAIKAGSGNSASVSPIQELLPQTGIVLDDVSHLSKKHYDKKPKQLNEDEDYDENDERDDDGNGDDDPLGEEEENDGVAENSEIKQKVDTTNNVMIIRPSITPLVAEDSAQNDVYKEATNDMNCTIKLQSAPISEIPEMSTDSSDQLCYTIINEVMNEHHAMAPKPTMHKAKKKNKSSKREGRERGVSTNVMRPNIPTGIVNPASNVPKMLPAKTKDNKMVMVRLIEGTKPMSNATVEALSFAATTPTLTTPTIIANLTPPTMPGEKVSPIKITMLTGAETQAVTPLSSSQPIQQQQQQQQHHKSMSREFIALQRSVKESKVLRDFVTETSVVKMRKRRKSGALRKELNAVGNESLAKELHSNIDNDSNATCSSSQLRRSTVEDEPPIDDSIIEQKMLMAFATMPMAYQQQSNGNGAEKRRKFTLLKDEENGTNSLKLTRRSRSKSVTEPKLKKWSSDDTIMMKRTNMRSQNSDFVQKQRDFLQRVRHQEGDAEDITDLEDYNDNQSLVGMEDDDATSSLNGSNSQCNYSLTRSLFNQHILDQSGILSGNTSTGGDAEDSVDADLETTTTYRNNIEQRLKGIWRPAPKPGWDSFCWKCRDCGDLIACTKCLRCYHSGCIKMTASYKLDISTWVCAECAVVDNVLYGPKRVRRHELSLDMLSQLLSFALNRMRNVKGYSKQALHEEDLVNHSKYVANPVTFSTLQEKIEKKAFRCAEEFVNETKWILHNALILTYGTPNSKEVLLSKTILKVCRQEANEIDTCPECYLNANTRSDWFVDVCTQPHLLVWAKLKGFPYWPAKAMGLGQGSHVNVRFFGEHDRAFVPVKDCFLYSEQDPNMQTGKRLARELADCITEVEVHVEKIRAKVGDFKYAPYRTPYDPNDELAQLELMMPGVGEYMRRQQTLTPKPSLQYKIVKTADNHLSIIKKPAVASESGNDSDTTHSSTPPMRKKAEKADSIEADVSTSGGNNTPCKSKPSTSKYEVISKAISDDSNSSKVSTVILKRKSISNNSERKRSEEPAAETPLAKLSKFDEGEASSVGNEDVSYGDYEENLSEAQRNEKYKNKNATISSSQQEPHVPLLTITTKCAADNEAIELTSEAQLENIAAIPAVYQKSVEQLVKQKQGVTIKKISKDVKKCGSSGGGSSNCVPVEKLQLSSGSADAPIQEPSDSSGSHKMQLDNCNGNKTLTSEANVKNYLKGLVPFIEPKKEILTDEEEEVAGVNDEPMPSSTTIQTATATQLGNQMEPTAKEPAVMELLTTIKQEVLSDEEQQMDCDDSSSAAPTTVNTCSSAAQANEKNVNEGGESLAPVPVAAPQADGVRVVGGTTIQRISSRNGGNAMAAAAHQQHSSHTTGSCSSSLRRSTARGVPYGPLPASAMPCGATASKTAPTSPTSAATANAHISNGGAAAGATTSGRHVGQRARKSFPNRSPTDVDASVLVTGYEQRPLKATSMVSIPVDVASKRGVPVPPLTAVSKALPGHGVHQAPAPPPPPPPSSAAGVAVGGITPLSSNMQPAQPHTTQQSLVQPSTSSSSSAFCNGPMNAALLMSAPPPLAGLSQTPPHGAPNATPATASVSSNCVEAVATTSAAGGGGGVTTDSHLLADLVTPTLASAITDVICRGPPKMLPRPDGPLQSEGSTMFPSQAGPVCRTLVENAHKLTDFFISVMEDTMREVTEGEDAAGLQAKLTLLTMEFERKTLAYEKEITELKRTSDLMLCEMRKSMENEKTRLANEIRKQCEQERLRSVEETKKKQWCAHCGREAQFYCCWNTSYCDYPCQQLHWPRHATNCAQTRPSASSTEVSGHKPMATSNNNVQQDTRAHRLDGKVAGTANTSTTTNTQKSGNTSSGSKKEKHHQHSKVNQNMTTPNASASITAAAHGPQPPPEVLKLPQNTYLRPVTANTNLSSVVSTNSSTNGNNGGSQSSNSGGMRTNAATFVQQMPYPVQRFSIPLPITAPVHANSPYTLIQRGNNWELRPTSNPSTNSNTNNSVNSSTPSAVVTSNNMATLASTHMGNVTTTSAQQQTQQQHHHHPHHHTHHNAQPQQTRLASGATITTNIKGNSSSSGSGSTTGGRSRNANAIAAATLIGGANSSGSNNSGHLRPNNQM